MSEQEVGMLYISQAQRMESAGRLKQAEKLYLKVKEPDLAINMYKKFGYTVYRRVLGYYGAEEDAFDMRKAMGRDPHKKSMVPLDHPVYPEDLECD